MQIPRSSSKAKNYIGLEWGSNPQPHISSVMLTGQKMGFLTIGNVTERWVAVLADITGNNPSYRIHDISQCMSGRG